MKIINVKSKILELTWIGPAAYGQSGLQRHTIDPEAPDDNEINRILEVAGLYMIIGDHQSHGSRSLLYIGQTKDFKNRILSHRKWLRDEWRVEVYLCELGDNNLRSEAEKLLIYAHSPPYNSKNIETLKLKKPISIWNVGRYWRLLPEVSSQHCWYQGS